MRKFILAIIFLLLIVSRVGAQTTTRTLEWDYLATTLASVNTYATTLKIDTANPIPIVPVCGTVGADTHCANPIILTAGNHTITITAVLNGNVSSGTLNYIPGQVPTGQSNIKVTITVTIP